MITTTPVPARRLKYAATINDEALSDSTDADFELAYIDIGNVDSQGRIHDIVNYRFEDAPSRARRIVRDGDVIISTVRTYLQAIAPIENPPDNLIVSTGFAVVRPSNLLDHRFCKYVLRANTFLWEVESRSTGVSYPAINASDLGDIKVSLPEIRAQRLIADYLDRETARIDGLIAEKERMLALLEEKRAALISRVVTRGLDPNAPLKPSGLEWLGEIPAHWDEIRLGYLVSLHGGATPATTNDEFWEGKVPWASPKDIKQPVLSDTIDHVSELALAETNISLIEPSVLLLVVRGMILAKAIPTSLTAVPMTINQDMKALRPVDDRLRVEYLKLIFDGLQEPLSTLIEESAHGTRCLRTDMLKAFKIPIPPFEEQASIVRATEADQSKANALRENLQLSITLAKERRVALITAAVTGQVAIDDLKQD